MSGFGLNGATETSIDGEFEKDVSFDYDRFELDLSRLEGEDYFDCVLNGEFPDGQNSKVEHGNFHGKSLRRYKVYERRQPWTNPYI